MSGFPARPTLDAFGPTLRNRGAVRDPSRDVGADLLNLMRWQLAGLGACAPLAFVAATFTAPDVVAVAAHANGWQGAAPALTRTSAGVYVVAYELSYPDKDGGAVATKLVGAHVTHAGSSRLKGEYDIAQGAIVNVRLTDKDDASTDGSFFLTVF
ncbi:MAG TPA: hypothetical protein VGM56_25160 [Byssovorax sp.]